MRVFFLVPARDGSRVESKVRELESMGYPYVVVCGADVSLPGVVHRTPIGKWDAINFGSRLVPQDADIVAINDVDTTIHDLGRALEMARRCDLVYCAVDTGGGPQASFYAFADPIRARLNLFASGELMVIRKGTFEELLPIPPCMAEDSYLLFKAMELKRRVGFCRDAHVTTSRTKTAAEEVAYKERTTLGILQALDHSRPPLAIRLFYRVLPLFAIPLTLLGTKGNAWAKGMLRAVRLHAERSDRTRF